MYFNLDTPIEIICPKHGSFWQTPRNHLYGNRKGEKHGSGCPQCGNENKRQKRGKVFHKEKSYRNTEKAIEEIKEKTSTSGITFDKTVYKGYHKPIVFTCAIHGDFSRCFSNIIGKRVRGNHLCPQCSLKNVQKFKTTSLKEVNQKVKELYGDSLKITKIDLEKGVYRQDSLAEIKCKTHGKVVIKTFNLMIGLGCPECAKIKSSAERIIKDILIQQEIPFEKQKVFEECKNIRSLRFDFFLPEKEIAIEYQGKQHFVPVDHFGGIKSFKALQKRDQIKREFCKKEGIRLIEIPYTFATYQEIKTFLQKEVL